MKTSRNFFGARRFALGLESMLDGVQGVKALLLHLSDQEEFA
jgi:hypothetical protein